MSLNEENVKKWVREEVRRIIDTGLFYTTEIDKQAAETKSKTVPMQAPAKTQPPPIKEAVLSPRLDGVLKYERDEKGVLWAKVKNHLTPEEFGEVAREIEDVCGAKYTAKKGWELP